MKSSCRLTASSLLRSNRFNSFVFIFSILLTSLLVIGGCNNNNNNGDGDLGGTPPTTSGCMPADTPCVAFNTLQNGGVIQCVLSQTDTCAVDLSTVASQTATQTSQQIDESTVMWIEAWGGYGGNRDKGTAGGVGGYAVTTSTVSDIASKNNMSTVIYYFVGSNGPDGGNHCGAGGGAATIITFEDLTLNPSSDPTQQSPPILLVAGGAGGGVGGNLSFGCDNTGNVSNGADGGVAIATESADGKGAGQTISGDTGSDLAGSGDGGSGGSDPKGGSFVCVECGSGNQTDGMDGFGGLGGSGGNGQDCTGPGKIGFINTGTTVLSFQSGGGGDGSSNTSACDAGGGGGGGGAGGGGGGGHGNDDGNAVSGGGGGSFSIMSTQSSFLSPTTMQDTPCTGVAGCVSISFVVPQ
jgi:hypothetical protein